MVRGHTLLEDLAEARPFYGHDIHRLNIVVPRAE